MDRPDLGAAAQPDALRAALAANADHLRTTGHAHPASEIASVRAATYKRHEIVIRTTYEITVNGHPFDAHVNVDNSGRVHYHGLPTRDFSSTVSLVKKAIDYFPEDFPLAGSAHGHGQPSGRSHGAHGQKGDD